MQPESENEPPAEWIARYWQWIYSKPKEENPLKTGEVNNDEFLCLPCTGGGESCDRVFNIRGENSRKHIIVPVFASEYSGGRGFECYR